MANKTTSFKDEFSDDPGGTMSETTTQVKDKITELGRAAADKIDGNREATAGGLNKAASTLHDKAGSLPGGETVSDLAHATAAKLSSTADYVRSHDANRMMADVQALVKNNPGYSLLAAAVIGFLAGRAFSSND